MCACSWNQGKLGRFFGLVTILDVEELLGLWFFSRELSVILLGLDLVCTSFWRIWVTGSFIPLGVGD